MISRLRFLAGLFGAAVAAQTQAPKEPKPICDGECVADDEPADPAISLANYGPVTKDLLFMPAIKRTGCPDCLRPFPDVLPPEVATYAVGSRLWIECPDCRRVFGRSMDN